MSTAAINAPAASLPEGKYVRTGFELDLADGHYLMRSFISYGMQTLEEGVYTLTGGKINFLDSTTSQAVLSSCGNSSAYSYRWSFDPFVGVFNLTPLQDTCQARQSDMTRAPLVIKPIG
jgi:hypothetical protein